MNFKKIAAAAVSALILTGAADNLLFSTSYNIISSAEETTTETVVHSITFLDFDGNVMDVLEVEDGAAIDYSLIDTSQLSKQLGKYSQIRFHSWDNTPETASEDTVIQALYEKGTISLDKFPARTEYYSLDKQVNLDGLEVTITFSVQTPEYDEEGNRITVDTVEDISLSCYASPSSLSEAFSYGDTAVISIYPQNSQIPLASYEITYFPNLGNAVMDSAVDAIDASFVLTYYAKTSTGTDVELTEIEQKCCDVDRNGSINALDASLILTYYAKNATQQNPDWDDLI